MKRIIFLLCCQVMAMVGHAQGVVEVRFNGESVDVNVPSDVQGVTWTASGAHVTITSSTTTTEYTYALSGESDNGSLVLNGSYKLTLELRGLQLINASNGAAIDIECGKRIAMVLADGTNNTLTDAPTGTQKAALYFKGHPEFKGAGTLNVTGRLKHAISAKEYIELKKTTGCINILGAVGDGIHCGKGKPDGENNYFLMNGGTVDITQVGDDGIDADDYGAIRINGGALAVNVGDAATALKGDSIVAIAGGVVSLAVSGDGSKGICACHTVEVAGGDLSIVVTGNGSKAIMGEKGGEGATVANGGFVSISGGKTILHVLGEGMDDGTGNVSPCVGMAAGNDISLRGGEVTIVALGKETTPIVADAAYLVEGCILSIERTPWKADILDCPYDMTLYVVVEADGSRLDDYANKAVGAFIDGVCVGYGVFGTTDFGTIRVWSHDTSARKLTFKVYDYETLTEYEAVADSDISFSSMSHAGTPGSPVVLNYQPHGLLGDVNLDGDVNVTDVMLMVDYILLHSTNHFYLPNADMDDSHDVNVTDVMLVVAIVLGNN